MVKQRKGDSCHLGSKPVKWGRTALVWTYCLQSPGVTRETLAGFPVTDPAEMLNIPTSLSPRGSAEQFQVAFLGARNSLKACSGLPVWVSGKPSNWTLGTPDLASARTVLYCLNLGRDGTYTVHSVGKEEKRELYT